MSLNTVHLISRTVCTRKHARTQGERNTASSLTCTHNGSKWAPISYRTRRAACQVCTNRQFFEEAFIPVLMISGSGHIKSWDEWNYKRKARVNLNRPCRMQLNWQQSECQGPKRHMSIQSSVCVCSAVDFLLANLCAFVAWRVSSSRRRLLIEGLFIPVDRMGGTCWEDTYNVEWGRVVLVVAVLVGGLKIDRLSWIQMCFLTLNAFTRCQAEIRDQRQKTGKEDRTMKNSFDPRSLSMLINTSGASVPQDSPAVCIN